MFQQLKHHLDKTSKELLREKQQAKYIFICWFKCVFCSDMRRKRSLLTFPSTIFLSKTRFSFCFPDKDRNSLAWDQRYIYEIVFCIKFFSYWIFHLSNKYMSKLMRFWVMIWPKYVWMVHKLSEFLSNFEYFYWILFVD